MKKNLFGKNIKLAMLLSVASFLGAQEVMAATLVCPYSDQLRPGHAVKAGKITIVGHGQTYDPELPKNLKFESDFVSRQYFENGEFTISRTAVKNDSLQCIYTKPGQPDLYLSLKDRKLANQCNSFSSWFDCSDEISKEHMNK